MNNTNFDETRDNTPFGNATGNLKQLTPYPDYLEEDKQKLNKNNKNSDVEDISTN